MRQINFYLCFVGKQTTVFVEEMDTEKLGIIRQVHKM